MDRLRYTHDTGGESMLGETALLNIYYYLFTP